MELIPIATGVLVPPGVEDPYDYEILGYHSSEETHEFAFTALSRRLKVIGVPLGAGRGRRRPDRRRAAEHRDAAPGDTDRRRTVAARRRAATRAVEHRVRRVRLRGQQAASVPWVGPPPARLRRPRGGAEPSRARGATTDAVPSQR